jgi:hypothetical protein
MRGADHKPASAKRGKPDTHATASYADPYDLTNGLIVESGVG